MLPTQQDVGGMGEVIGEKLVRGAAGQWPNQFYGQLWWMVVQLGPGSGGLMTVGISPQSAPRVVLKRATCSSIYISVLQNLLQPPHLVPSPANRLPERNAHNVHEGSLVVVVRGLLPESTRGIKTANKLPFPSSRHKGGQKNKIDYTKRHVYISSTPRTHTFSPNSSEETVLPCLHWSARSTDSATRRSCRAKFQQCIVYYLSLIHI